MIEVVVRQQYVRGSQPETLGGLDQRLDGTAGVDEERGTPLAVGDEVGVGHELRMADGLDEHRAILARNPQPDSGTRGASGEPACGVTEPACGATSRVSPSR